jgi:hypothetical protein
MRRALESLIPAAPVGTMISTVFSGFHVPCAEAVSENGRLNSAAKNTT